jgi:alpha-ketoglutarate-dependent taurine dioxygenase
MNIRSIKRKPFNLVQQQLIKTEFNDSHTSLPLIVKLSIEGVDLIDWAINNKNWIERNLLIHEGLLFRGFQIEHRDKFEDFIRAISGELLEYSYRSTPRTLVKGKIYTSTEYPAEQFIPLHNEMSYSLNWPLKIWFFCLKVAEQGGEIPIADSRKIFKKIDPKIRERLIEKKLMYVRNYGRGLDLEWENVFQTNNKSEVANYCDRANINFEWKDENRLKTRQVCQAIAIHPKTKEIVWFNQAHLFHVSSLQSKVRESLLSVYSPDDLPRNVFYGDGTPIEDSIIEEINQVYQQETVSFSWQEGDILMLDNMLVAHGRNPFIGARKVLVGMAEEVIGNRE